MDETPLRRRLGLDQSSQAVVDGQGDDTGWQPAPEEQGDGRTVASVRGVVRSPAKRMTTVRARRL